jgi:hypothetical protein
VQFLSWFGILFPVGILLLGLQVLGSRIGRSQVFGITGLLTVVILFGFTFRAGWVASFENSDIPREMLVYTQTAPDIHNLVEEIARTAELTGDRFEIKLAIDIRDAYSWPWQWYLRRYNNVTYSDFTSDETEIEEDRIIAVINENNNASVVTRLPDGFSDGRKLVHRWWFPESYREVSSGTFLGTLIDRDKWAGSVDYFLYRKLANPIGTIDSYVYFSDEVPFAPTE